MNPNFVMWGRCSCGSQTSHRCQVVKQITGQLPTIRYTRDSLANREALQSYGLEVPTGNYAWYMNLATGAFIKMDFQVTVTPELTKAVMKVFNG